MKLHPQTETDQRMKTPNELGQFIISIDDGFVEYQYLVKLPVFSSIGEIRDKVMETLQAEFIQSSIRTKYKLENKQGG
jgi:hypothetical protein